MSPLWAALEWASLTDFADGFPDLFRIGPARGARLYRQCFIGGPCGVAWLVQDQPDDLVRLLDGLPTPGGPFQQPHFFDLVARVRLELYLGRGEAAWGRLAAAWPSIRRSGFLLLRWFRLTLGILL